MKTNFDGIKIDPVEIFTPKETLLEKISPIIGAIILLAACLIILNESLGNPLLDYFTK